VKRTAPSPPQFTALFLPALAQQLVGPIGQQPADQLQPIDNKQDITNPQPKNKFVQQRVVQNIYLIMCVIKNSSQNH
jgi:hypothetical protein